MTTVQVTLPDELAEQAEKAGLLASDAIEQMLRKRLKAQAASELLAVLDRLDAVQYLNAGSAGSP